MGIVLQPCISGDDETCLQVIAAPCHDSAVPRTKISLFRRIERALETIALGSEPLETLHKVADYLAANFSADLGLRGGRIYEQDDGSFELVQTFGEVVRAPVGLRIWRSYPAFEQLLDIGTLVIQRDDPRLDQRLEKEIGTRACFAAIAVADARFVLSFDVDSPGNDHDEIIATLNIVRLAINQKLREDRMREVMEDTRRIQLSILPRHLPHPGDFEIAARSIAAELVGGDFYDVITLDETTFDVAIADATGHGLPAALQVRDVFTGLRMGLSREFKLTRTIERLNHIIHRSRLATKFVSLFLAEINLSGAVIYCNAGHPAPLVVRSSGSTLRLTTGGMILGPMPDAKYSIGLVRMAPGDVLALYSDGITEAYSDELDQEYGEERLAAALRRWRHHNPGAIVERIFREVTEHSHRAPPADDQTVLIIKRQFPEGEETPA
jgi:sigma-B regulation protein RsbU (phosphoserine phosphatase)